MAVPNRALIMAPVARSLYAEHPDRCIARIPGATDGTNQVWDTLDQDFWQALGDPQLTGWGTLTAIPNAIKKYVVQVLRYDTVAALIGSAAWKRLADCGALDFIKTNNGVKVLSAFVAGDRPTEWAPMHEWLGKPGDTLGAP
jgi:hypothetical protein